MSVTLSVTDVDLGVGLIYVFGTTTLSGTYPTGGDSVDWTSIKSQIGFEGQIVASSMSAPAFGPVQAAFTVQGGTPNIYNLQQGASPSTWKLRGYTSGSGGAEFTGGSAYPSSATGDTITFSAVFRKLL
jgi:hypothetical protein